MKKIITLAFTVFMFAVCTNAQSNLKKVYDENADQLEQISQAVKAAGDEGKHVICQVGGNWCKWCLMFAGFITSDNEISKIISDNYIYIHVNYNPRTPKDERAMKMLARLGNPERFGFPVLVVLDSKGNVIHTQDSSFLEEGNGYNRTKVIRFFTNWTPSSCSHRSS